MKHEMQIRVYYEDTDAGGIVYYANYLRFAERGRTEWLRAAGFESSALKRDAGIIFVVRHIDASYHGSARLDDILTLSTFVSEARRASFVMKQSIFCQNNLLFSMNVALVCVGNHGKAVGIPKDIQDSLNRFLLEQ